MSPTEIQVNIEKTNKNQHRTALLNSPKKEIDVDLCIWHMEIFVRIRARQFESVVFVVIMSSHVQFHVNLF